MSRLRSFFSNTEATSRSGRALAIVTVLMVAFGMISVASAGEGQSMSGSGTLLVLLFHELAYVVLGAVAFLVASRINIDALLRLAQSLMYLSLALLIGVLAVGRTVSGGQRWISLGGIVFQPSELFKLTLILYVCSLLATYHRHIRDWVQLAMRLAPVVVGLGLVVLEHDIGTTGVLAFILMSVLIVANLPRVLVVRASLVAVGALMIYTKLSSNAWYRLTAFLHPREYLNTFNYQLLQSRIALGSGGLTGLGLGHSHAKWGLLPNPQTDFVYSIIGEEWGFIGSLCVIGLFVAFIGFGLQIARTTRSDVRRVMAMGIIAWFGFEAIVNIASVVGLMPVIGVPLPLFSYGGTALIVQLAAVGLLFNIANDPKRSEPASLSHVAFRAQPAPSSRHAATHRRVSFGESSRPREH